MVNAGPSEVETSVNEIKTQNVYLLEAQIGFWGRSDDECNDYWHNKTLCQITSEVKQLNQQLYIRIDYLKSSYRCENEHSGVKSKSYLSVLYWSKNVKL